jgi:hypothetical protein
MRPPSPFACAHRATPCGLRAWTRKGKLSRFYRVPVRAEWGGMDAGIDSLWSRAVRGYVVAESPAAAANYWLDFWAARVSRPVTVEAVGPQGGSVWRSAGWDSVIGARMMSGFEVDSARQLEFAL